MNAMNPLEIAPARIEDLRLVSGQGRYAADWNITGQVYAHMIRSDRPHALIKSLDLSAVRDAAGVVLVLTAQDVTAAGFKSLPTGAPLVDKHGVDQKTAAMPLLADGKVCFVGQPIAMVIATSAKIAQDASELAVIDYEELPAYASINQALAEGVGAIHPQAPNNIAMDFENGNAAAVAQAFAKASFRTTHRIESQRLIGAPMEPRAALASYDATTDRYQVMTPTQGMLGMRGTLSAVTGIAAEKIDVVAHDVGGSFGLRGGTYSEQSLLMLASKREMDSDSKRAFHQRLARSSA
jgi:aerobic carbon-monoxide dehydrogenase large subunit